MGGGVRNLGYPQPVALEPVSSEASDPARSGFAEKPVAAVVLGAGASKRMHDDGRGPKLLLTWNGRPILVHVLDTLHEAGIEHIVVVLARADDADARAIRERVAQYRQQPHRAASMLRIVHNPAPERGMASSFAVGVEALRPLSRWAGVLMMLGDQPAVPLWVVRSLLATYRAHCETVKVLQPRYKGKKAHPLVMAPAVATDAPALGPDQQLRELFWPWADARGVIDIDAPGVVVDIDTYDDYRRHRPAND